jgi:hypothetical protein
MTKPTEVADVLRRALAVLRERGLVKGHMQTADGRVCSYGAMSIALVGQADWQSVSKREREAQRGVGKPAQDLLEEVIAEQWPDRVGHAVDNCWAVVDFNNHPDTTQDDVEKAFEKAIARAEEMI